MKSTARPALTNVALFTALIVGGALDALEPADLAIRNVTIIDAVNPMDQVVTQQRPRK